MSHCCPCGSASLSASLLTDPTLPTMICLLSFLCQDVSPFCLRQRKNKTREGIELLSYTASWNGSVVISSITQLSQLQVQHFCTPRWQGRASVPRPWSTWHRRRLRLYSENQREWVCQLSKTQGWELFH